MPRKKMARAANGAGSIRKRTQVKNGKSYTYYEARCTVGYNLLTGKQIQKSISGKTKKEVQQKLSQMQVDVNDGSYIEPSKQTVGEWLDIWLETYVTGSVKPYTEDSYRAVCENHIKPLLGKIKLGALSAPQIQQMYNVLVREKGLSAKTVKNVHGVLHRALNKAVQIGSIRHNPADVCDLPKVYQKEIVPLEEAEITAFLNAIHGSKYERLYQVTLFTGLRQGEVLGLTWDCVDFKNQTLYINKQLQKSKKVGGEYRLVPTKNGKARLLVAAPSVMRVLRQQKVIQTQMQLLSGPKWENKDNLVFTNEQGGHLVHVTVYKEFKKIVRSLGLDTRFHDLRHTYAVSALECGDTIKTVQNNLGHASAAFTLNIYAHTTQKIRQESANRMEKFIESVSGGQLQGKAQ